MCQCLYCMCMCVCVYVCVQIYIHKHTYRYMCYQHPLLQSGYMETPQFPASSLLPLNWGIPRFWPGYKLQPTEHKHKWLFLLLVFCCWITNHHKLNSWRQYLFVSSDFYRLGQLAGVPCLESHEPSGCLQLDWALLCRLWEEVSFHSHRWQNLVLQGCEP